MPTTQTNGIDTATFEQRDNEACLEWTITRPPIVIGDDASDPTHDLPVVMLGNGEYRRAIHADGVGVLWKDMLILAAVIVAVGLFVLLIGG